MLQQTQVATVVSYFDRFVAAFPDVRALADASIDDVLALWSGLGYYRRAHHLHAAAKRVVAEHRAEFPRDAATLATLPGIGRSTAAAIAAFTSGERVAILDGNVRRVLARHRAIKGFPAAPKVAAKLWAVAEALLPGGPGFDIAAYTQGMMDVGATLCRVRAPLATIEHGFTHFALTLHPQRMNVARWPSRIEAPQYVWLARDDALNAALPSPIRKLLRAL